MLWFDATTDLIYQEKKFRNRYSAGSDSILARFSATSEPEFGAAGIGFIVGGGGGGGTGNIVLDEV